jgi:NitT/TauT family transport system permease protein
MALHDFRPAALGQALRPNIWDLVALILVIGAMVLIVYGGEQTTAPLSTLDVTPVSLDPANLPAYALRTTMRMRWQSCARSFSPSPMRRSPPRADAPKWC